MDTPAIPHSPSKVQSLEVRELSHRPFDLVGRDALAVRCRLRDLRLKRPFSISKALALLEQALLQPDSLGSREGVDRGLDPTLRVGLEAARTPPPSPSAILILASSMCRQNNS
jgi:hypothetical protein